MNRIYALIIESGGQRYISQEAYRDYETARKFILERRDKPEQISEYKFMSTEYTYYITDLKLN